MNKIEAILKALEDNFDIVIVEKGPEYKHVTKNCGNCKYKGTQETKDCITPVSFPCDTWSFNYELF